MTNREIINLARREYGQDGYVNIDSDANVVRAAYDSGAWVAAWVWVDIPEDEDD